MLIRPGRAPTDRDAAEEVDDGAAADRDEELHDLQSDRPLVRHLGFGRIVVSEKEVPNMLVNLVHSG